MVDLAFARRAGFRACLAVVAFGMLVGPVAVQAAPGQDTTGVPDQSASWAVTLNRTTAYSGPSDQAVSFGSVPALTTLQVLGYSGDWAHVLNPRTREEAYLSSGELGPSDPPSRYVLLAPPPLTDEFQSTGLVTDAAPLSLYPTSADEAAERQLSPSTWLTLTGAVKGEDGSTWYRTDNGDFVPADAVFLPERTEDYSGRWIDVNLSSPTTVRAYDADGLENSFLAIRGAGPRPTPTGVFTILRRVANETMNSDTIGIPRFGPGGYYLTNVLFTQYFTGDGASFHYNYWSSNFGYPGSHGCLGLTYANSSWLWDWAKVGTPIIIHY
jgi:hypothetical protein